jgi:gas vesicle protein
MTNRERAEAFAYFAAGLGLGAAAVLMTTPRSGSETRRLLVEKGKEGVTDVIGEERIEKGRQVYDRAGEVRNLARDTADIVKRTRRVMRPLAEESNPE